MEGDPNAGRAQRSPRSAPEYAEKGPLQQCKEEKKRSEQRGGRSNDKGPSSGKEEKGTKYENQKLGRGVQTKSQNKLEGCKNWNRNQMV